MLLDSADMKPGDKYLKQLLQEGYDQNSSRKVLKLPCGCVSIELLKPEDVSGVCPKCMKPFYLVWQRQPKIRGA